MSRASGSQSRNRIVVQTSSGRYSRRPQPQTRPRPRELWVALSVIGAAALATFVALFLTSRPYDPMNSTVLPQGIIAGPLATPSPKPSPSVSGQQTAAAEQTPVPPDETTVPDNRDDAAIRAQIERTLAADPALAKLAVSTLVDEGRVTIVGAVTSAELKARIEKAIGAIKGVASVDNQLVVTEATP